MNLTAFVDVAIGLSLIYLGASLFVTIINEYIAQVLQLRGKQLFESLKELIDDPDVREKLKSVPSLAPFFDDKRKKSGSYVDPNVLAQLVVGALKNAENGFKSMEDLLGAIKQLGGGKLKQQLSALAANVEQDIDKFVERVSQWADRSLHMMGDAYKKKMQWISFGIGLGIAVVFNIDTVIITAELYRNKEAREATVAVALQLTEATQDEAFKKCMAMTPAERRSAPECASMSGLVDAVLSRNDTLGELPIGWDSLGQVWDEAVPGLNAVWIRHWIGWLLTALAISLGASFWFDLLTRLVNIRHGMRKPEVEKPATGKG